MDASRRQFIGIGGMVVASGLVLGIPEEASAQVLPGSSFQRRQQFMPTPTRGFNCVNESSLFRASEQFRGNSIRSYLKPQTTARNSHVPVAEAWQFELESLVTLLVSAANKGVKVIIDLHEPPNADAVNATTPAFWANDGNLDVLISAWSDILNVSEPYRDYIWGYDLLNEPYNSAELPLGASKWPSWAQQIVDSIRLVDASTPIVYEPSPGALPSAFSEAQAPFTLIDDPAVIYSVHMYDPHAYTLQGQASHNLAPTATDWPDKSSYPGTISGAYWDSSALRADLQPVVDVANKYNVPIYAGEFSAVRWAPGAAQYIEDCASIFEEHGWDWGFIAFAGYHGFDPEFTSQMTSDANQDVARATAPTDRELILKAHMANNAFATPGQFGAANLLHNSEFSRDYDADGLADWWSVTAGATASLVMVDGQQAQQVQTTGANQGLVQQWVQNVSEQNLYRLKARIRVDSGSVRFWHFDAMRSGALAGSGDVATITATNGEFVTEQIDFSPASGAIRLGVRFWSAGPASFVVDEVELLDLGLAAEQMAPTTEARVTGSGRVVFVARPHRGGDRVVRTEYRVVGGSGEWLQAPRGGVKFNPADAPIVGYRSIDSSGAVEHAKAVIVSDGRGR